jgi:glycosyltransferase involved in cell wall biosynthesis
MRFRLGPEHFVIGQFGLVSPRKRIHLLLNAAALLKEGHLGNVQPRLLIVGSPGKSDLEYEQSLRRLVVDKGLQEIARFIPFTPDVADIYRACDVNVLVSNEEGFGRTIIEAGAMGIPSVGARVGGIPEIIEDGETGLLVPEDDDGTALADRLRLLISHPARRAEMGEAARRRVADLFSIEKHAERIMAIYDRLLERKG